MGSRSRKRGKAAPEPVRRPAAAPRPPQRPGAGRPAVPGPLDEFSAVAAPAPATDATADAAAPKLTKEPVPEAGPATAPPAGRPKRLRGEEANAAIRAQLQPLAPGERPPALRAAVLVAAALGLANLVLALANVEVEDGKSSRGGAIIFAGIMFAAAWGMWNVRYWAILGFQTLLAITIVIASLAILVSSNLWALLLCVTVVGGFGVLFWKLVRVLSRVQMPDRPGQ